MTDTTLKNESQCQHCGKQSEDLSVKQLCGGCEDFLNKNNFLSQDKCRFCSGAERRRLSHKSGQDPVLCLGCRSFYKRMRDGEKEEDRHADAAESKHLDKGSGDGQGESNSSEEILELSETSSQDNSKDKETDEEPKKKRNASEKDSRTTGHTTTDDPPVDEKNVTISAPGKVDESGRKCGHCGNTGPSSRWAKWHNHRGEPILICNPCNQHRKRRGNLLDRFCHRCGNPYVTQYRRAPRSSLICYPCAELKPGVRELKATIDFNWFPGKPLPPSNKKKRKAWATAVLKAEAEAPPHVKARLAEEAERVQREESASDDAARKVAKTHESKPEGPKSDAKLGFDSPNPLINPFGTDPAQGSVGTARMGQGQQLGQQMFMAYPQAMMMPMQDVVQNHQLNQDVMKHMLGQQLAMNQQQALNQQMMNQQMMNQRQMAVRQQFMQQQQMNPTMLQAQQVQVAGMPQMIMNPVRMYGVQAMPMQGGQPTPQGTAWGPVVHPNQLQQDPMFGTSKNM